MDDTAYKYNAFGKEEPMTSKPLTITLRAEQRQAVDEAKSCFGKQKKGQEFIPDPTMKQFLWNAKMRFGKTICALELAREMNVRRTLIVTHRPVVNENFYEDFGKIFSDIRDHWKYGTKQAYFTKEHKDAYDFYDLEKFSSTNGNHYIFFASLQYLRRSTLVGGDSDEQLKKDILNTDWDLVVVDEAHEGTQTNLGQKVIDDYLKKSTTKVLLLTGTPFNLLGKLDKTPVFTWDYTMEQNAKKEWPLKHPGVPNPYAELPKMQIYTYSLGKLIGKLTDGEEDFNFTEFFRTWTGNVKADHEPMPEGKKGKFVHEDAVNMFLDKLCEDSETSNYPFSKEVYQENFHHTLWIVPGVKEAKALEQLLHEHEVFGNFDIKNVAGQNNEDEERDDALDKVKKAIGDKPEDTYTITLSCGRLTTGVTVPAWTAVLYMKGSELTSASTYMQTIFRVQSPCVINGKMKTECYVFDFSPDRTLKMIAETAKYATRAKQKGKKKDEEEDLTQEERDKKAMQDFIDLCPVISLDGGSMKPLPVSCIFAQLESVYVDRLVRNGFNDNCLYNTDELMKMDSEALNSLGRKIAQSTNMEKPKKASSESELNWNQLTPEQKAALEEARRKAKENRKKGRNQYDGLTEEEIKAIEEEKERKKKERDEREKRISNIRGIALRIPLMMYGGSEVGDPNEPLTVENFTRKIKDESWIEFMPRGVTKPDFNYIRRVFNATRFEEAGKRYRALAKEADNMHTEDRIRRISAIFDCFHNPDKETVLTPWRVVNMHMSDTLGGYCFYNEHFDGPNTKEVTNEDGSKETVATAEPRLVKRPSEEDDSITREVFGNSDTKILEINSKTGLYPLYVTYSLYRNRLNDFYDADLIENKSVEEEQVVWDDIVDHNIFVICNTPMAARITRRTLLGFRDDKNAHIKPIKLIERASHDIEGLASDIKSPKFWGLRKTKEEMKFTAVVGNPPYQEVKATDKSSSNRSFATALYPYFIDLGGLVTNKYVSLITPSRWMTKQGQGISEDWVDKMLNGNHFMLINDFPKASDCFPAVEIKGGVNYFLLSPKYNGKCIFAVHNNNIDIVERTDFLNSMGAGVVIRDKYAESIIKKVMDKEGEYFNGNSFSSMVSPKHFFDRDEQLNSNWKGYSRMKDEKHPIKYYLNKNLEKCGYGWIGLEDIPKGLETVALNKIYLPMAGGTGNDSQIIGVPFYGEPNSACSYTYLVVGYDPKNHNFTKEQCGNIISYMKTKFFRFMVSIKKKTQNTTRELFQFVPLQDFNKSWTDKELYSKYNLDMFECDYIERMINPMD